MSLTEQQKQEMKKDVFSIQSHEERKAIRLSRAGDKLSEEQRRLYSVSAAEQEELKIRNILDHGSELKLSEEDRMDLELRQNRNLNFLLMNNEKWGGDSLVMQEIKRLLGNYESLLHEKAAGSKNVEDLAEMAVAYCDELIRNCETYLGRGKSFFFWRKGRFDAVSELKERMLEEKKLLSGLSTQKWAGEFKHLAKTTDSLRVLMNEHAMNGRLKKYQQKRRQDSFKNPIALTEQEKEAAVKEAKNKNARNFYRDKFDEKRKNHQEEITKWNEKRIEETRRVNKKTEEDNIKKNNIDPVKAKEDAEEKTKNMLKEQAERDREELDRNTRAYEEGMDKLQTEMKSLKEKKNLSKTQQQRLKEIDAAKMRLIHDFAADKKVYLRNAVDIEVKKKVGYKVMLDLSEFESAFKLDEMTALVSRYADKEKGRDEALTILAGKLFGIEADPSELLDDARFTSSLEKYEQLSGMTQAFKRLLKTNPNFTDKLTGKERKRLDTLYAMSSLFRVKKQILLDPSYRVNPPVDLNSYPKEKENFARSHFRRMLAVSKVLERNLRLAAGMPLIGIGLKKQENSFAEADRLYALRLSKEPELKKETGEGRAVARRRIEKSYKELLKITEETEEQLKTAKDMKREKLLGRLQQYLVKAELLEEKLKKEEQDDPSDRIEEALLLIEEERFRVPQDYNMVPDLLHVPEKKKSLGDLTALFQDVDHPELKKDYNPDNALCKKCGYQEFEKWLTKYKKIYFNGEFSKARFDHSDNINPTIEYNDNLDRITCHFKGSHHLFRTDAEMREEIMALTFDQSPMRAAWQDDPEKMKYMEEMFQHKVLMLNSQQTNVAYRILYGGGSRFYLMTPIDKLMTVNIYMKMEMQACSVSSNVVMDKNFGNYLENLKQANKDGRTVIDPEGFGAASVLSTMPIGFHGQSSDHGERGNHYLPKPYREEWDKFTEQYMKEHKCSNKEAGEAFMMAHPEIWDNKKAWLAPLDDEDLENMRSDDMKNKAAGQFGISDQDAGFFKSDLFEPVSKKELDAYKKKIKSEGLKNYELALDTINGGYETMKPSQLQNIMFGT